MGNTVNMFTGALVGGLISSLINLLLWPAILPGLLLYKRRFLAMGLAAAWAAGVTRYHSKLFSDWAPAAPPLSAVAGDYASAITVAMAFALIGCVLRTDAAKQRKVKK